MEVEIREIREIKWEIKSNFYMWNFLVDLLFLDWLKVIFDYEMVIFDFVLYYVM